MCYGMFLLNHMKCELFQLPLIFIISLDIIIVMNAAVWNGWHPFDHFYFRDMVVGPDGMHQIHMIIAAQHVVSVQRATKKGRPILIRVCLMADMTS